MNNIVQQLTKKLTAQTANSQQLAACVKELTEREQVLRQIVDELFSIAEPGTLKNALWTKYHSLSPAEFDHNTYQYIEGDLYIQEVRAGRFTIHRYDGRDWEQLGARHSEQDIKTLVAPMQFLGESKGKRQNYRPTSTQE